MKRNYEEELLQLIETSPEPFTMSNKQIQSQIDGISNYQITKCLKSLQNKNEITKAISNVYDSEYGLWNNKRIIYKIEQQ
ncbi:hypothetical protein [Psychroserpens mesophilus]|uniref:hypothetical protein n=1 Tax=Psychroserpens mesophilus TaxID=325473 RepID=UPI003D65CD1F